jgi:uncharacterized protein (TIGR00251 family)
MLFVEKDGAIRFEVHAKPRAKRSRIIGERGDAVEIALAAPPVDGAANDELVRFVAEVLAVPRRDIELVRGDTSRAKLVAVHTKRMTAGEIEQRLRAAFSA